MSSPAPQLSTDDFLPDTSLFSPPPPEPETPPPTDDYSPPPPDISSPPPPDDYSPPPPDISSPPPPDDYSPPPPDISSPPPPDDYSPPPPDISSPPPPDDYSPPAPSLAPDISPPPPRDYSPPPPRDSSPPPPRDSSPPPPNISSPPPPGPKIPSPEGVSTRMLTGIIIVGVVTLLAVVGIPLLMWKKRKKGTPQPNGHFPTAAPLSGLQASHYDHPVQIWPPNAPAPVDHFVTISYKHSAQPAYMSGSGGSGSRYPDPETPFRHTSPTTDLGLSTTLFTYEELAVATNGFSTVNFLEKGDFGYVHKGVLRDGQEVVVKQLNTGSAQGEGEFRAAMEIVSRVHHTHLVSLVGYCITGSERMLVYEFVQNKTLEFHLHGKGRHTMGWSTRLKIALGAVKGLTYLHEDCDPKIIHRDIKASNILLDFNFEAKIADYGLADQFYNHTSTRVAGRFGYLAPEYAYSGELTEKSDVFSFGVVLLELITGRNAVDTIQTGTGDSLVGWARPFLQDGKFGAIVDPQLQMEYKQNEMTRMVACAAACVRHSANKRPRMSQVAMALEGNLSLSDLNEGVKPVDMYGSDPGIVQYDKPVLRTRKAGTCDLYRGPSSGSEAQQTRKMEMNALKRAGRGM